MMKRSFLLALLSMSMMAGLTWAWWVVGHARIAEAAASRLPDDMPKFFRAASKQLGHLAGDPDRWKNPSCKHLRAAEAPDHFLDLEEFGGKELPADRWKAIALLQKLGKKPDRVGFLPYAIMENYDRLIQLCYQNWQYHFEFLNLGYLAYLDFFGFCKEIFPGIPDLAVAKMVQGVDMELFRPDDELKKLAALAVELCLQSGFENTDNVAGTMERIHSLEGGQQWVEAYTAVQDPWFNFTVGNGFYGHDKYWIEHQEIPLSYIKDYVRRLEAGHDIVRPVAELIAERDRITEEYRDLVGAEHQATFEAKRGLAATAYPYVENHNFYIEHWTMGVFWRKVRQLGAVFVDAGFWSVPEDMLYLNRGEVRDAIFDLVTGWAVGAEATGPHYWPQEIERRRGIFDALASQRPQPALNTPPAEITEPFTMMLYGITTEQVQHWLDSDDGSDDGSISGMAASPGVVEGRARVVTHADMLGEVQEGEILVATITAPSWGPIFGKIKATVTDIGGMMSHAAIVCREYGLPAVTGTGSASTTIKTGQLIRVDGTAGRVEILEG